MDLSVHAIVPYIMQGTSPSPSMHPLPPDIIAYRVQFTEDQAFATMGCFDGNRSGFINYNSLVDKVHQRVRRVHRVWAIGWANLISNEVDDER